MSSEAVAAAIERLFQRVPQGAEVVTPTRRLARLLREAAAARAGAMVSIHALEDWWRRIYHGSEDIKPLAILPPHIAREVWHQAAARAGDDSWLLPDGLAEWAARAYGDLCLWRQTPLQVPAETPEAQVFLRAVVAFEQSAAELGGCSAERALGHLVEALAAGTRTALPPALVLTGFDELPPLAQGLMEALRGQGVNIARFELEVPGRVQRAELPTAEDEWRAAAIWAAEALATAPDRRIAVVVPGLPAVRQQVARVFNEVLDPAHCWPEQQRRPAGFNMSAAETLAQTPLVSTALALLALRQPELTPLTLNDLLQSPHWGSPDEYPARAALGDHLRAEFLSLTPRGLEAVLAEAGDALRQTRTQLQAFYQIKIPNGQQGADSWAALFDCQLDALNFARGRTLDSIEYQQVVAWTEVLASFASLGQVVSGWTWSVALARLRRLAARPFQPETLASPVQILGMLEAAGQVFDALWITGLSDHAWPETPRLNPLLPARWQRQLGLPRTTAEGELELAARLTQRLAKAASEVVFSSPAMDGDRPLAPSALIAQWPMHARALHQPWHAGAVAMAEPPDWCAPPLPAAARTGGSALLRDQAACPFKAFARHRLAAVDPTSCRPGLDPRQRGVLLHAALERLWAGLQSQSRLLQLSPGDRAACIEQAVAAAARELPGRQRLGGAQLSLERDRAAHLLEQWLALEARRPPFVVVAQEDSLEVTVGPLRLNLRFDRLDQLEQGGVAVVDYKTSSCQVRAWDGGRPDEPQVPLYALAMVDRGAAVAACAFAELRAEGVRALGLADSVDAWPELPPRPRDLELPSTFPELLAFWRQTLEQLAQTFADGVAAPAPKAGQETCRRCDLQALCRAAVGGAQ